MGIVVRTVETAPWSRARIKRLGSAGPGGPSAWIICCALWTTSPAVGLTPPEAPSGSATEIGEQRWASYRAHVASAEKALRLNEGPEAKVWLNGAPVELRGWEWRHLRARVDESERTVAVPESAVTLAVSRDGRLAATSDVKGKVQLWSLPGFERRTTLEGHTDAVYSLAFDAAGRHLATVSRDVTARVWDVESGKEVSKLALANPGVAATTFSPDGTRVATCSWLREGEGGSVRGVVWIWNPTSGEVYHRSLAGIKPLDSIAYAPDGKRLVVGSWDGLVHVFDDAGKELRTIPVPDEGVYRAVMAVAISPDGKWVAAGAKDRNVHVWSLESGEVPLTLRGHTGDVHTVMFLPDGNRLASAAADGSVRLWDFRSGEFLAVLRGHDRAVKDLSWDAGTSRLVTLGADDTVRVWNPDVSFGAMLAINTGASGSYTASFSPDGSRVAVAMFDGRVLTYSATDGRKTSEWPAHTGSTCNTLGYSGDGRFVVTCSWDQTAKIWDSETCSLLVTLEAGKGVGHCALNSDGSRAALAVGSAVQVWDVAKVSKLATLEGHTSGIEEIVFDKHGTHLASAGGDGTVRVWDVANAKEKFALSGHQGSVSCVSFREDGRRLASGDRTGMVLLWDLEKGELLKNLAALDGAPNRLAFSPDGKRVAAGGEGVALLDAERGGVLLKLAPHKDTVWHLSFSPDGGRLATCSWDGTIAILMAGP